jgi:hypothetical protein
MAEEVDKEVNESMRRSTKKARPGTAGTSPSLRAGSPHPNLTQQAKAEINNLLSPSLKNISPV